MRRLTSLSVLALVTAFVALAFAGCKTTAAAPEQAKVNKEDMIYIPPSTGHMTGRWVPRSDAGAPGTAPTSGVNPTALKTMQVEGLKNSPTSPSVNMGH